MAQTPGTLALLIWAALAALGSTGCAGPLTADVTVAGELHSLHYHLAPDGRITVSAGSGLVEGGTPRNVHESRLDSSAMNRLKNVVFASGFLLEDPPLEIALSPGASLQIQVSIGLWENSMDLRGQSVSSVASIVAELNRHLPDKVKIVYDPAPPPESIFDHFF